MYETTVKISGMVCGMCEAHINDAVRRAFPVKKAASSHARGETVILSERPLDEQKLRAAITEAGYDVASVRVEPCEKRGLFGFLKK
jgi:copper chaperone